MKKIIILMLFCLSLIGCESESTDNVSKITYYAIVTLNGEDLIVLNEGDNYVDEGATAAENGLPIDITIEGTVDTSKPDVYKINYTAKNSDGYPSSKTRTVIVLSTDPSTVDLEGTWFRNGNPNNVIKLSERYYQCDNATGYTEGNENNLKMNFYNIDDEKIYAPFQKDVSSTGIDAESNIGTIVDNNEFQWVIYASSFFGTSTRVFTR